MGPPVGCGFGPNLDNDVNTGAARRLKRISGPWDPIPSTTPRRPTYLPVGIARTNRPANDDEEEAI